jgi:hypothetical protein
METIEEYIREIKENNCSPVKSFMIGLILGKPN